VRDIGRREDLGRKRGHENDPFRSEERAFRDLMSAYNVSSRDMSAVLLDGLRCNRHYQENWTEHVTPVCNDLCSQNMKAQGWHLQPRTPAVN
jgi:hypothetical protein